MSKERIKPPARLDSRLNSGINYIDNSKRHLKFDESYLKQEKIFFIQRPLKFHIVSELNI